MTKLLILGGGVAGLDIASNLGHKPEGDRFEVGLVEREPAHVWKPMLHTIAAGTADVSIPQTSYVAQAAARRFRLHPGEVMEIDRRQRWVGLGPAYLNGEQVLPARKVDYEVLLIALGSHANDFATPGVKDHCFSIDSRTAALSFNDHIRARLLKAALAREKLTVAIVGGGATGVELAAELVRFGQIAENLGLQGTRAALKITLLNADERLLNAFSPSVSLAATDKLRELGVDIRNGVRVREADSQGFVVNNGERLDADIRLWAAGIRAPAVLDTLDGLDRNRSGQLIVGPTLASLQDPTVFALGDCASVHSLDAESVVPATAQAAFQQASYLLRHLPAILDQHEVPPFRYRDFGSLITLGGYDAYGSLGRLGFFKGAALRGGVAQLGHALLYRRHQSRLHGFRRGSLLWLSEAIASGAKPLARLT